LTTLIAFLQVDIWMSEQEEAKKFGIQYLKMEIF